MKNLVIAFTVSLLAQLSYQIVDLTPAYRVHIGGVEDYKLVSKYEKDPIFVEGLEMVDDNTIIESAGLYTGSKI